MTSLPRPNFLVIDEGWGALDGENLQNVSVLMDYLKTQFKFVIIISHIDSIKDIVDHQISVDKKKDGFSRVVHG
jgi:DNA repair exonuclease SbcCD ATPase subunit